MKNHFIIPMRSLQLFAEGAGDGGTAQGTGVTGTAAGSQQKGVKGNPLAAVKYGIQPESAPDAEVQTQQPPASPPPDRNAEFDQLIRGDYKDAFDARVQKIVQSRLKGTQETVERYNALAPVLDMLAQRYGLKDVSDVQALAKAMEEDDSLYADEAMRLDMTVPQLKQIRKMERENAQLRQQMQAQQDRDNADRLYAAWLNQSEEIKKVYPGFDLKAEMQNPRFQELLRSNIDMRTAYEVIHKDEIIPAAMQFAAQTAAAKTAQSIASGRNRPRENGNNAQGAAMVKSDVSKLTKADRQEIARRVARGEKIRF